MNVLHKIFQFLKAIVLMPINIANLSKRADDLSRIEKKLDLFNQKLADLDFGSLTASLNAFIRIQSSNGDSNPKADEQVQSEQLSIISSLEKVFDNHFSQFESLLSIHNALPNLKLLPATRGWAGSPDFLAKIAEVILMEKPRFVLEAGSGVSTVIIGLAMKMNNVGKAISLEHQEDYATTTRASIELNEIADVTDVKYLPLTNHDCLEQHCRWYDTKNLIFKERIDVLIVDGPPRNTQFLARFPAVPLLHEYFSDRVLILLDDSNRSDETITVQKWTAFLEGNQFTVVVSKFDHFEKGMVILEACRLGVS